VLENKNILIGVTGSIAIYKTLELIRLLVKAGANVRVLMSEEAKRFITPLTFEAISQNKVLHVDTESWSNDNNHIYIGKWADIFLIAPASANTINKIASGIADNLLLSSLLAFNKIIILAPAANTNMILNPITQESIIKLKSLGYIIANPQDKLLACNDKGVGAMSEPQEIFDLCARELLKEEFWCDKEVIITGGGTVEKIDDVRCLSNFSSGKMANALAYALYLKGSHVTLITSKPTHEICKHINLLTFQSAKQLEEQLLHVNNQTTTKAYLFMASAVSDYVPVKQVNGKIKKESLGKTWNLELAKNKDILANLDKSNLFTIGFKAECDEENALANAQNMLKNKNLDAVCLNVINTQNNFGSENNAITFVSKKETIQLKLDTKFNIAWNLANIAKEL
jgi:phosphopantothenoylcysteine decarboxylase/phosphopantothenate--cysteine ligase